LLAGVIAYGTGSTVYIFGTLRASRSIHGKLIEAILGTTLRCVSRCFVPGLIDHILYLSDG
jgi:hypothetical protein